MSFRLLTASASALLFAALAAIAAGYWYACGSDFDQARAAEAEALQRGFGIALLDREEEMLALATMVAADGALQRLLLRGKHAVAGEGGRDGGPRAAAARAELLARVGPQWQRMQHGFNVRQLQFHIAPDATSFLRVHAPERFGDTLAGVRHIVDDVFADWLPRSGFETGRVYSGIRGVVPVWARTVDGGEELAGVVEAGTSFEAQLDRLDSQFDAGWAVVLRDTHVQDTVWADFRDLNGSQSDGRCRCHLEASSRPEAWPWLRKEVSLATANAGPAWSMIEWQDRHYHLVRIPLYDYLGRVAPGRDNVGLVLAWRDRSAEVAALHDARIRAALMLLAAWLLSQVLLLALLAYWRRHWLRRLEERTAELARERHFSEALLSASPAVTYRVRLPGAKADYISPNLREVLGYDAASAIRDSHWWENNIHPEDLQRTLDTADWRTWKDGRVERRYRFRHADGSWRWLEDRGRIVTGGEDDEQVLVGSIIDISARMQSEERVDLALRGADLGLWDWRTGDGSMKFNTRWASMLGYRLDELEPRLSTWEGLVHPDDLPTVRTALEAHLRGDTPSYQSEYRMRHRDGHWLWILARGRVMERAADGSPLRAVGTHLDISARREAEQARRELLERLQKLAGMVPGLVYQYRLRPDGSSCFPYASEAIRDIYRVAPEDVREDASAVLAVLHPDDVDAVVAAIAASAETLTAWRQEYRVRYADGEVRWLSGHAMPQREADGSTLWHGFISDATARKLQELELRRLATTDTLTGLPNRRYFMDRLTQERERFLRFGRPAALLMFDLDFFKRINDHHGHAVGDEMLRHFARESARALRRIDLIGRLGGEEFAALLPDTDLAGAHELAERIRATVERTPLNLGEVTVRCTVSIGATVLAAADDDIDAALLRADAALYRAKRKGRNRVESAAPDGAPPR